MSTKRKSEEPLVKTTGTKKQRKVTFEDTSTLIIGEATKENSNSNTSGNKTFNVNIIIKLPKLDTACTCSSEPSTPDKYNIRLVYASDAQT